MQPWSVMYVFSRPGQSQELIENNFVIISITDLLIPWVILFLPWLYGAPKPKLLGMVPLIIKLSMVHRKEYWSRNSCAKHTAILLHWWILPVGGVASGRVCHQRGYPVKFRGCAISISVTGNFCFMPFLCLDTLYMGMEYIFGEADTLCCSFAYTPFI